MRKSSRHNRDPVFIGYNHHELENRVLSGCFNLVKCHLESSTESLIVIIKKKSPKFFFFILSYQYSLKFRTHSGHQPCCHCFCQKKCEKLTTYSSTFRNISFLAVECTSVPSNPSQYY